LEGALTYQAIREYYDNILWLADNNIYPNIRQEILNFLTKEQQWVNQMIQQNPQDTKWQHINLIQQQVYGMYLGYNDYCDTGKELPLIELVWLNSFPDSLDLANVVSEENRVDWLNIPTEEAVREFIKATRCSGFIKPVNGDLLVGHSTWIFFSMLNRIFKYVDLPFQSVPVKATKSLFSSYPGQIVSADDFYVLSSGLAVLETSNAIFNMSLYSYVTPMSLFSWHRTALANRLATGGGDWANLFSFYNSGTYNNQWMVIDYNQWQQNSQSDVLWIVEQIPGAVISGDETELLNSNAYWPSYNIPFFPYVFNISGYYDMEKQHGDSFSYQKCARANIFRRNETAVEDLGSLKNLMRYNNYKQDPLSNNDPSNAICSRIDLESKNPQPFGCTDSKVVDAELMSQMKCDAICGPTADQQPPFSWMNWPQWTHEGQPNTFDFSWQHMTPDTA
jgi:hypothetical protein